MEDLNQRVRLGLHYLDNNPDEKRGWMPYFSSSITGVPHYTHWEWDACDVGWRMVEAYILARQVINQTSPNPEERKLRAFVLGTIREDGLSYRPERPWCKPHAWMWDHGRALIALSTWLRLEPAEEIAAVARRMADGLAKIAQRQDDSWYYPAENWMGDRWGDTVYAHPPTGLAIEGLVDLARLLGEERFLVMAERFVRAVRNMKPPLFDEDGTLIRAWDQPNILQFTHIHSRLAIVTGILKYGLVTGHRDLVDWCARAYLYVKNELASSFGWVPEGLEHGADMGRQARDEVCCMSDMMQIAAILADHGLPEEQATIGRYGTNHLWAHQIVDLTPLRPFMADNSGLEDTAQHRYTGMPERALGAFTGCSHPNEITADISMHGGSSLFVDASGCCSPAGIKSLNVLWKEAAQRRQGDVHVNLWITLENDDVVMRCDEPETGQLQVSLKRGCDDLIMRVPDYVMLSDLAVNQAYEARDRDLHLGPQQAGDAVAISYPLAEQKAAEQIAGCEYQVRWRGGRVVDVAPAARGCPAYWWRMKAVESQD